MITSTVKIHPIVSAKISTGSEFIELEENCGKKLSEGPSTGPIQHRWAVPSSLREKVLQNRRHILSDETTHQVSYKFIGIARLKSQIKGFIGSRYPRI